MCTQYFLSIIIHYNYTECITYIVHTIICNTICGLCYHNNASFRLLFLLSLFSFLIIFPFSIIYFVFLLVLLVPSALFLFLLFVLCLSTNSSLSSQFPHSSRFHHRFHPSQSSLSLVLLYFL